MSKIFATLSLIAAGVNAYVLWDDFVGGHEPNILLSVIGSVGFIVFGLLWARSNIQKRKAAPACSDCECDHK